MNSFFILHIYTQMNTQSSDIQKVLYTSEQISGKIQEMADKISQDYKGKPLTLIGILKGSYVVLSDLSRALSIPHQIDFMSVSSYTDTESTGLIKVMMDLRNSIKDRHVIVVEDILDSGLTLSHILEMLETKDPASIGVAVLLRKPTCVKRDVNVGYLGFDLNPPEFVVGYGLDYNEFFRNLPYIGVPTQEAIDKYKC
jgi:hypoxanthine phosphoribosyltransferase